MSTYNVKICWRRKGDIFIDNKYNRAHQWEFDGGAKIPASSSPQVVPLPYSDDSAVDPEEAFLASLSSCHMLWFLSVAAKNGFVVEKYNDDASAIMAKNEEGKLAITRVILQPVVTYESNTVSKKENLEMHEEAHEKCFIASSVRTEIEIKPIIKIQTHN